MSLTQTIPGSRLPAEKVVLFQGDNLDAFVPEFPPPLEVQVRPNAEQDLLTAAKQIGLQRSFLRKVAISAFLDRLEKQGGFRLIPRGRAS